MLSTIPHMYGGEDLCSIPSHFVVVVVSLVIFSPVILLST